MGSAETEVEPADCLTTSLTLYLCAIRLTIMVGGLAVLESNFVLTGSLYPIDRELHKPTPSCNHNVTRCRLEPRRIP